MTPTDALTSLFLEVSCSSSIHVAYAPGIEQSTGSVACAGGPASFYVIATKDGPMSEPGNGGDDPPLMDEVRSTLASAPVRLAILFGSAATGRTHPRSDIDIAIELDGLRPGDPGYNDVFFGLSAELSAAAQTDEIDLVDIHSATPTLARSIVDHGRILVGSASRVDELRTQLADDDTAEGSARERFDEHLARIDDLLA